MRRAYDASRLLVRECATHGYGSTARTSTSWTSPREQYRLRIAVHAVRRDDQGRSRPTASCRPASRALAAVVSRGTRGGVGDARASLRRAIQIAIVVRDLDAAMRRTSTTTDRPWKSRVPPGERGEHARGRPTVERSWRSRSAASGKCSGADRAARRGKLYARFLAEKARACATSASRCRLRQDGGGAGGAWERRAPGRRPAGCGAYLATERDLGVSRRSSPAPPARTGSRTRRLG